MQTDLFERLDTLSQESRQKLNEQIKRVQEEARQLRAQARRLRRAQHAETKKRKKLLEQVAQASKGWGQNMLQRSSDLASSGQQKVREGGGNLVQAVSQRGNQVTRNLTDWSGETNNKLRKQGQRLSRTTSDWSDDTMHKLRKQGQQLTHSASDWSDDTMHKLRKQGQNMVQNVSDWGDETAYNLRKQGRNMGRNLLDRKDDTTRQLRKQGRALGRNLASRKEETAHQLRKQGRALGRNLASRKDDMTHRLRRQRDHLTERSGQLREPARSNKFWSTLGFISGLLLAGGMTYWLVKRNFGRNALANEQQIELSSRETLNGIVSRPGGGMRYANQGGTAVATKPVSASTSIESSTRFVGVLSTRQYYPLARKPDVPDLVYFETEEDARAEGFNAAD